MSWTAKAKQFHSQPLKIFLLSSYPLFNLELQSQNNSKASYAKTSLKTVFDYNGWMHSKDMQRLQCI